MLGEPHLQQAEHGVAYVEAMPPVVVGDGPVALPHCVHPSGQCLVWGGRVIVEQKRKEQTKACYSWGNPHHCSHSMLFFRGIWTRWWILILKTRSWDSLLILTTVCTTGTMMSTLIIIFFFHIQLTHLCRDFEFLNYSKFKEHANASFDEVKLWDREVAEGEQVQTLSVDILCFRAGPFLKNRAQFMQKTSANHWILRSWGGLQMSNSAEKKTFLNLTEI